MSAPRIPNLLSSRAGPRSRGRGRGFGRGGASNSSIAARQDQTIQSTDTDAAVSRLSAVTLGYLYDPYAKSFVDGSGTRRLPIINRGTYTRTAAIDSLVDEFLASSSAQTAPSTESPHVKQIISLGAGTDTRYFRLRDQNKHHSLLYHEIDFPKVSASKRRIVTTLHGSKNETDSPLETELFSPNNQHAGQAETQDQSDQIDQTSQTWGIRTATNATPLYVFHPLDLRALPERDSLQSFYSILSDIPTLIISECVLCYLEVDPAEKIMKWFMDRIANVGVVIYEPICPDDPFGNMMVQNLKVRGIVMPTVQVYKSLEDQLRRLKALGFEGPTSTAGARAQSVEKIWNSWIPDAEMERVNSLEGLDEVEEWTLLASHYAVVWGWRAQIGFEKWQLLHSSNALS